MSTPAILSQAADWIERRSRGLTPSQAQELSDWLGHPDHRAAYACDITYVTNNEIGFD